MDTLLQDIRYTFRQWGKAPGFVAMAVLTIAIGSGGTTTIMSVTDAVLLRSLPGIQHPDELVEIRVGDRAGRRLRMMPYATYQTLRNADNGLTELAAVGYTEMSVAAEGREGAEITGAMAVSGSYFSILGTRPALGRLFTPEEDVSSGSGAAVVLSYAFWMSRFDGDPSVLGRSLSINRIPFTVIGVTQKDFHGHLPLHHFSIWVPLEMAGALTGQDPAGYSVLTVGRMEPGVSIPRVRAAAEGVAAELRAAHPMEWASTVFVVEPHTRAYQEFRGPISLFLGFLMALSCCILLIACFNLAGALLSRATVRAQEVAVRRTMGASRARIVRQLLTETLLLFLVGAAGGGALALWATNALGKIPVPREIPFSGDFGPDVRVLVASLALTLAVGVLFGLAPALRATGADLGSTLRDHRGQAPGRQWLRRFFVVAQVVGAVVLLGGSGVLFRALGRAADMDLGFKPEGAHVASVNLGIQQYTEEEGRLFFHRLLEGASYLPEVQSAALADFLPLASPPERSAVFLRPDGEGSVEAGLLGVSPDFFRTMKAEVLEGRAFGASDVEGGEPVAMVNETVARMLWPEGSPLGQIIRSGDSSYRVVGVARNGKYIAVGESPLAAVFLPQAQYYVPKTSLILRVREGSPDISRTVQNLVRSLDPMVPLSTNESYSRLVGVHFMPRRLAGYFAGILGLMGLFLASVGLYGVLSQMVTQRSQELAIRMALGAQATAVRRLVIWRGMGLVATGLILGIPLALALSNFIRIFLYGMDPVDRLTFGSIIVVFGVVGFVASYLPALRATRTDPARILRQG